MGLGRVGPGVAAAMGVTLALSGFAATPATAAPVAARHPAGHHVFSKAAASFVGAKTVEQKVERLQAAAAGLPRLSKAYDVQPLWDGKIDGAGATVATLVSFGDADIKAVIDAYDQRNGLPPADVQIVEGAGKVPKCTDPGVDSATCESWGGETDLDVEMIHTMAPGAKIIVAATPVAETEGITGLPEMMQAVDYLTTNKLVDVISMSFGATEETFDSFDQIKTLDPALDRASAAGITLVASSGDQGASGTTEDGTGTYGFRVAGWPASDSRVTALGGTVLHLNAQGTRTSPDSLWQDSGGGLSKVYGRPDWQNGVSGITGSTMRSFPDITMEGIQGTSESSPLFAGVLALAVQSKHGRLGQINGALYGKLGPAAATSGIVDVTVGNNNYGSVVGYTATAGFDIVSGWGTIDAAKFVPALVTAVG
ncbi:MAG: S53 family peptidase [Kutzneria sp.]|nr:S53 family peptidase [Kutzneria sp.]